MRSFIALILCLWATAVTAQEWEDRRLFNEDAPGPRLTILSSTDTDLFAPFIEGFVTENPRVAVDYLVTGTADLDRRFRETPKRFDIVISSAMDLQLKLINDGFGRRLSNIAHPPWAQWRQSLFAFTSEPAAIVIRRASFEGQPIPETRQALIQALRDAPDRFRGKVGTYDIRSSGLGYLFATQDARASETYWRLMEVMGGLNVRLYCCSGDMIDDLISGRIAVAYNVLGSYAAARVDSQDALKIVLPSDLPTTMMRTALVSAESDNRETAETFLRHLLARGSDLLLPPLDIEAAESDRATIALEPALMTFLDTLKRKKFLSEWEDAVIQK